jgi:flagellar hook-basal body complex protein FliE
MALNGISNSPAAGIENVLAQLRMAQQRAHAGSGAQPAAAGQPAAGPLAAGSPLRGTLRLSGDDSSSTGAAGAPGSFAAALQSSLDQVSAAQNRASELGKQFEKGQGNVDLNDVMLAMQKANVGFQAAVQVRNRLVGAYQTIMNMQI